MASQAVPATSAVSVGSGPETQQRRQRDQQLQQSDPRIAQAVQFERRKSDEAEATITALLTGLLLAGGAGLLPSAAVSVGVAVSADEVAERLHDVLLGVALSAAGIMSWGADRTGTLDVVPIRDRAEQTIDRVAQMVSDSVKAEAGRLADSPPDVYQRRPDGPGSVKGWATRLARMTVTTVTEDTKTALPVLLGLTHQRWLTRMDTRVRDSHRTMEGQFRRLGEKFTDGDGNELAHPGDPDAPLSTVINCRCRVVYFRAPGDVVETEAE